MTFLELTQIVFNLVVSFAVITITAFLSIIAYEVITGIKSTKKFIANVEKESSELYAKINSFLENIFNLSFVSQFFKKKKSKGK